MKKGWETEPLGELCDIRNGSTPSKGNPTFWDGGTIPWFTIDDMREQGREISSTRQKITKSALSETSVKLLPENSVLLCCTASVGEFAITRIPLTTNQQFNGLVVKNKNRLDPNFLFHYASTLKDELLGLSGKTTIDFIPISRLRDVAVPVPPLAEQQRIVGLLDEAFEGLATAKANAEKNLQNARALFESHLQSVFTQRDPGWVETTLGEIGKVSMCKRIFKEETTATGDIPFYKIGTFGKEPDAFIPSHTYNEYRAKYSFPDKGAVLISAAGTIGRRVRYDGEPAYFQDSNIVWIENDEKQALNDYLYHFYGACDWNSTKGATIPRLYNDNLRRISIGFPKSLQEQRRIVARLDALSEETQRLARLYERKHAALEALKKSLLHQAFTGAL